MLTIMINSISTLAWLLGPRTHKPWNKLRTFTLAFYSRLKLLQNPGSNLSS